MPLASSPIWTVLIVVLVVVSLGIAFGPTILKHLRDKRIRQAGVDAEAEVVELIDTGNRHNMNPEVRMKLTVLPAGGEPFPAELKTVLSPVDIPKYQAGARVRVKYDPADLTQVVLIR
jgi:hypothetical protein